MLQPLDTLARGTADKGQIHNVRKLNLERDVYL